MGSGRGVGRQLRESALGQRHDVADRPDRLGAVWVVVGLGELAGLQRDRLADGWAFAKLYTSEKARRAALPAFLHDYNHHRPHTAIGKLAPITRLKQPGWTSHLGHRQRRYGPGHHSWTTVGSLDISPLPCSVRTAPGSTTTVDSGLGSRVNRWWP